MITQYERKMLKQIEEQGVTIHPLLWEVLLHRMRNEMQLLVFAVSEITERKHEPEMVIAMCQKILERLGGLDVFLKEVQKKAKAKMAFNDQVSKR